MAAAWKPGSRPPPPTHTHARAEGGGGGEDDDAAVNPAHDHHLTGIMADGEVEPDLALSPHIKFRL